MRTRLLMVAAAGLLLAADGPALRRKTPAHPNRKAASRCDRRVVRVKLGYTAEEACAGP
jgi:hypothetical protein